MLQDAGGLGGAGGGQMLCQQGLEGGDVVLFCERLHGNHLLVDPAVEVVIHIQGVDHAAAHAGGEVPADGA